jgi:hypothetical protein
MVEGVWLEDCRFGMWSTRDRLFPAKRPLRVDDSRAHLWQTYSRPGAQQAPIPGLPFGCQVNDGNGTGVGFNYKNRERGALHIRGGAQHQPAVVMEAMRWC